MAIKDKNALKNYFKTGDVPTQSNFGDLIDSLQHTTDIPAEHNHDEEYYKKEEADTKLAQKESIIENDDVTVLQPLDGTFSANGNSTGAIKIKLPTSWSTSMLKICVEVYDYKTFESFSLILSGYNYGGTSTAWINTSAQIIATKLDRNFKVRFGHDGEKCCVYIGELNTTWSYLDIAITKVMIGFNHREKSRWLTGWDISVIDDEFSNVTKIHAATLVAASDSIKPVSYTHLTLPTTPYV